MKTGELLKTNLPLILSRWEQCVRENIETASQQQRITLRDHLPPFLDALCLTLDEPHDDEHAIYQVDMSKVHGETRADLWQYDLYDVLQEYSYLRRVIINFLFENGINDRKPHGIVHRSLDLAMSTAGQQFMDDRKKKLEAAVEEQKEVNSELDKFVAVAAHDLRSPLATMIGFLELATEHSKNPVYEQRAMTIARRSLNMVESLLRRARLRNGILDQTEFQISEVVNEIRTTLVADLTEKKGELVCTRSAEVRADRSAISQLLQNLIANSLKFMKDGVPPRIEVECEEPSAANVVVHIKDNGIGIQKGSEDEIFRAFHREGEKSGALGLGLGLDTCRQIAVAHGGTLRAVESGNGAHFILTLPKSAKA